MSENMTQDRQLSTPAPGLVLRLSLSDLRHEWILTVCLMLAVSAVIAPLLLLFGLKFGTIETLRHRLIQDPRNREIRPVISTTYAADWFDQMRAREDVAFITPLTRQISATATGWIRSTDPDAPTPARVDFDLIPTGAGDALLLENGVTIPGAEECVLTALAAEALGAQIGDELVVQVSRTRGSRREVGEETLRVTGILDMRAGALRAAYVMLDFVEDVESFRDGQAVPRRGWAGSRPDAYPQYDGVVIVTPDSLSELVQRRLGAGTGFTRIVPLESEDDQRREAGYTVPAHRHAVLLSTQLRATGAESITAVENQLRGQGAVLLEWIRPIGAQLEWEGGSRRLDLRILPAAATGAGTDPQPPWDNRLAAGEELLRIAVAMQPGEEELTGLAATLRITNDVGAVAFPVTVDFVEGVPEDIGFVQSRLGGILRLAEARPISFEAEDSSFLLYRRGYAGFRLYARRIEDVDHLRRFFEGQGLSVHTEAEQINTVMEMDRYLTLIFWLIAAVGIAGCVASLVASLYASVERKKRELSVLRLIGVSGGQLYRFPVYQGAFIAAGGFALALSMFGLLATTINRLFASHLQHGESFCRLPEAYIGMAWLGTIAVASLAAVVAVVRLARIDPAEALRDE